MRRLAAALLLFLAASGYGASFDCKSATTKVEKTICASPRISALDDEMARVYTAARKAAKDPAALKREQQAWIKTRNDEEYDEYIEGRYLQRLEHLRHEYGLFASAVPPASIFGHYGDTNEICTYNEKTEAYDCEGEIESFIDVKRGKGNAVRVKSTLYFDNGHECNIEGVAEWTGDELRLPIDDEATGDCVLVLRFDEDHVNTFDRGAFCKDAFCGARGSFYDIDLVKVKPSKKRNRR